MNSKFQKITTGIVFVTVFVLGIVLGSTDIFSKKTDFEDYFVFEDNTLNKNNFADKYYGSLFYEPLNGSFSQNEISDFLKEYIQNDYNLNGQKSEFVFAVEETEDILFYYTVNTSTGTNSISVLIDNNTTEFPEREFLMLDVFVKGDVLTLEKAEVFFEGTVKFSNSEDLMDYINTNGNKSVFFERGWLDVSELR